LHLEPGVVIRPWRPNAHPARRLLVVGEHGVIEGVGFEAEGISGAIG
jgi:hypothetical protein